MPYAREGASMIISRLKPTAGGSQIVNALRRAMSGAAYRVLPRYNGHFRKG